MTSGIDTESIVTKMMAIERRPQDLLNIRVTKTQKAQTAWQAIADKLTALKSASDALAGLDTISKLRSVTSSNTAVIGVRAIGAGANLSSNVEVVGLAAAKSVLAGDVFASASDAIGARTLDITASSGATTTITSTDGTLGGLAAAVNNAGLGVNAKVLQTAPGQYQLSLTATSSGTAASFNAAGTGWTSLTTVRAAANSQVVVDGVTVTRSTNVLTDVLDGVELTLVGTSPSPVSVTSTRDDSAIIAKVKGLVDAIGALASGIGIATKTSSDSAQRGPLAADVTARQIMDSVRRAISQPLTTAGGTTTTASALGISLTREGAITFDAGKLSASLTSDPDTVMAVLGSSANSTANGVSVVGTTSAAATGTRAISVTVAATRATLAGAVVAAPPTGTAVTMNFVTPGGSSAVSFATGATTSQTVDNLNAALRSAGVKVSALATTGGAIDLVSERYGTGEAFTATGGAIIGLDGASADGVDAAGTIDSVAFTANGRSYTSGGLILNIGTTSGQIASGGGSVNGNVSFAAGLASSLAAIGAQGATTGSTAASARSGLQDTLTDLQKRIARYDDILKQREQFIRARFTSMESLIQKLQGMTASISSLTGSSSSQSS
ncbi:MAG: flagellar filament capping protein FliD [Actinomycetia bacterium]|nr:flagellar filament capping protein FliD [Actinomycetes bacterium]